MPESPTSELMSEETKQTRKPDYNVSAMNKSTEEKGRIGAAWINQDGSISITLDAFIVLPNAGKDLLITLFPKTR